MDTLSPKSAVSNLSLGCREAADIIFPKCSALYKQFRNRYWRGNVALTTIRKTFISSSGLSRLSASCCLAASSNYERVAKQHYADQTGGDILSSAWKDAGTIHCVLKCGLEQVNPTDNGRPGPMYCTYWMPVLGLHSALVRGIFQVWIRPYVRDSLRKSP